MNEIKQKAVDFLRDYEMDHPDVDFERDLEMFSDQLVRGLKRCGFTPNRRYIPGCERRKVAV